MIFDTILTPFLRLPHFKGKTRIEQGLRRLLWTPSRTEVRGRVRMELDLGEWLQMQLLKRDWLEPLTLDLYERLLRPGDTFVDVGAHVGFHSLVARQLVGAGGLVLAVEPQPYNAQKILANWRANDFTNIRLVVAAAGAEDAWVELADQIEEDHAVLTLLDHGGKDQAQRFAVPLVRLESVLARNRIQTVKLLKVDVEGYELEVIRGLGSRLQDVENVILEVLDTTAPDRTAALLALVREGGFEVLTITGAAWKSRDSIAEANLWARRKSS